VKVPNYVLLRAPKAFALYVIVMLSNFHTNKKNGFLFISFFTDYIFYSRCNFYSKSPRLFHQLLRRLLIRGLS